MPAYDLTFNPPAPVADVEVVHPTTGAGSSVVRGKLDSGADVTVIPDRIVTQLGLTAKGRIWTRGYDGSYAQRAVYYVRLVIEGFTLASVRCIATDRTEVLLGRNALNHFIITLDGKSLRFDLKDP